MEICYKLVWEGGKVRGPNDTYLIGYQVYQILPPIEDMHLEFPSKNREKTPENETLIPTFMVTGYRNRADTNETTLRLQHIPYSDERNVDARLAEERAIIKILIKEYGWKWGNPY